MERLVRSCYKKKSSYVFAKKAGDIAREYGIDRIARLASNENPEPLSPQALLAAEEALREVNRYPDERGIVLMNALRAHYGDYHFVTGVGMDPPHAGRAG
jgi:histidinol-phosphate aminotransferase